MGFGVWDLGFRGLGLRDLGFKFWRSGCRVLPLKV